MTSFLLSEADNHVGKELGVSGWLTVRQDRIDRFADATEDRQWIHVDVERALKESPFGGPIAHGYLSLSLVASLAIEAGVLPTDATTALNYGIDRVRFLSPVRAGSRVRLRVSLLGVERKGEGQLVLKTGNTLEIDGSDKPALIAETLVLAIADDPS